MHAEAIIGLAPLNLHILCEKPLATTLDDCLRIYSSLLPNGSQSVPTALFAIGHVLRYTPHNILLRKLLVEDKVIGDIIAVEHTEPVGTTHFSHSYVR
jgi:predicted dehydrogenase